MTSKSKDPYGKNVNSVNFDFDGWLTDLAADPLLMDIQGRQVMTKMDPFAFALIYLTHHLKDANGDVSFSDAHLDWVRFAQRMSVKPNNETPARYRDAFIAPRATGKSTWWFLIIPLWLAAHGHSKFIAAFADTGPQAQNHLLTFKAELDNNALLRQDFPRLVAPMTRPANNRAVSDNQTMYQAKSGFVFSAKGADSGNLGLKVGEMRPDFIICDDLEPSEANYSLFQAEKRLGTLLEVILPLNVYARVVMVGTVTMSGSIIHQLVKSAKGVEIAPWIKDEKIKAHYYPALIREDNGTERSIWPTKWPLQFLKSMEHTRQYLKNYANDPMGVDGAYWTIDSFRHETLPDITHKLISLDPAVTSKATSDFTGIAKIAYSKVHKRVQVEAAVAVRLTGKDVRQRILQMIADDPEIQMVLVETNQGGDLWKNDILHDMPVPVQTIHQSVKKEVRAAQVLNFYERGWVLHSNGLNALEEQMTGFPLAPNDDLVDAVGSGIAFYAKASTPIQPRLLGSKAY